MARTTAAKFRHVPVVERSRLAGIVSIGDVMKWRLDEPKHESARASLAPAVSRWTGSRRWRRPHALTRWEHEHLLEAVQQRLDANPHAMRLRRETVEHPFGTMKPLMAAIVA